jgi:hypothetical protein
LLTSGLGEDVNKQCYRAVIRKGAPVMNQPFGAADVGPLAQVEIRMKVVDADGVEVGSVDDISMSDADAVTTDGEDFRGTGGTFGRMFTRRREPLVPEPLRTRLIRIGYIKLAGHGLPNHQRYVRGDRIARVASGRVELSVRKEDLATDD